MREKITRDKNVGVEDRMSGRKKRIKDKTEWDGERKCEKNDR